MALITCQECNREISEFAKTCPHCGYKLPKIKKLSSSHKKKRSIVAVIGIFFILIVVGGGYFFFSPRTVEWFCYHHISDATCTEPEMCSRCGKTWGSALGHKWQEATCTEAKTCTVCGAVDGLARGHVWREATCTEPKTCTICNMTEGWARGHRWDIATCTTAKTCRKCGATEGKPLGHYIQDYMCARCGISVVTENDVPNILDITSLEYEINSVGGIDVYMTFVNKLSTKTINYITVEMEFLNAVGDVLRDNISKNKTASLLFTGPLNAGETSRKTYWRACFYNSTFSGTVRIKEVEIEYSDGSTLVLDENVAKYVVKAWR